MDIKPFPDAGFLSDQMNTWAANARERHAPWIALALRLNARAMIGLYAAEPKKLEERQVLAATMFGRTVQSYQATLLLAVRGMASDARTLVRAASESAIALAGISVVDGSRSASKRRMISTPLRWSIRY